MTELGFLDPAAAVRGTGGFASGRPVVVEADQRARAGAVLEARYAELAEMGMSFLLNVVAIRSGQEPDWSAAEQRIDALRLKDLDRFFRYWDHDGGSREEAAADDAYVPRLRGELRTDLDNVRSAFDEYSRHSTTFEFAGFRFLATGGESVGSVPTELYDPISCLHAVGALEAAGFVAVDVDDNSPLPDSPEDTTD